MAQFPPAGQNPRYNKTFRACMKAPTLHFFTRVYAGVLPQYQQEDFDIWVMKPGYVIFVMQAIGQGVAQPPLTDYQVDFLSAQRHDHNFIFHAKDAQEIIYQLSLKGIPATYIGWDY